MDLLALTGACIKAEGEVAVLKKNTASGVQSARSCGNAEHALNDQRGDVRRQSAEKTGKATIDDDRALTNQRKALGRPRKRKSSNPNRACRIAPAAYTGKARRATSINDNFTITGKWIRVRRRSSRGRQGLRPAG